MNTIEATENIRAAVGMLIELKWTVSRGYETAGYNICTAWDAKKGKRLAHCLGGGYDLEGTSIGNWIEKQFQPELIALANSEPVDKFNQDTKEWERVPTKSKWHGSGTELYGLTAYTKGGEIVSVSLDGGCGKSCIERIFQAIGLNLRYLRGTKSTNLYEVVEATTEGKASA